MQPEFMRMLVQLRTVYGKAMQVTSGFRCAEHNKKSGGEVGSQHLLGNAVDIAVNSSSDRYHLLELALQYGFNGIGIAQTYVHLDGRKGTPVMWVYPV